MRSKRDIGSEAMRAEQELAKQLNFEEQMPEDIYCVSGLHPNGNSGGYVPVYEYDGARVFYCTVGEEWYPYDDE